MQPHEIAPRMRARRARGMAVVAALAVMASAWAVQAQAQEPPRAAHGRGRPLASMLDAEGQLKLPAQGIRGGIDPTGFRMVNGQGEAPRFVPTQPSSVADDARWDDRFTLRGTDDRVCALAWDGTGLYMGGVFSTAGGVAANNIARWTRSRAPGARSAGNRRVPTRCLGAGLGRKWALRRWELHNGRGVAANSIARWDPVTSTWSPLRSGTNSAVYALAWDGNGLYVGGCFTRAGLAAANGIARWDGTSWSKLGSGVNGDVTALAWDGSSIYAGGWFTTAGGVPANRIARWDGTSWSPLGSGTNDYVYALVWDGANLYAGGSFTTAGGIAASHIARWNGTSWTTLDSGMGGLSLW